MNKNIETIASFPTLMYKAKVMSNARLHGSEEEYTQAKKDHDIYKDICLNSDRVSLNIQRGAI